MADENKLHKAHTTLTTSLWEAWKRQHAEKEITGLEYSRIGVVALSQVGATIAVDCGLTEEQFVETAKATFKEAYEKAPKFG